jgi:hypothetical protein
MLPIHFNVPTNWDDVPEKKAGKILHLIFSKENHTVVSMLKILVILFHTGSLLSWIKLFRLFTLVPLSELSIYTKFIYEKANRTVFPQTITIKKYKFYGPKPRLTDLTIEEFSLVDAIFMQWIKTKNEIDLDRLATILYRPKTNGVRHPFDKETIASFGHIIPKAHINTKLLIAFAYMGSRLEIVNKYPLIFPKPKKEQTEKPKNKTETKGGFKQLIQLMAMHEMKPLGDLHKVKRTNVYDFFDIITADMLRVKELEKAYKT